MRCSEQLFLPLFLIVLIASAHASLDNRRLQRVPNNQINFEVVDRSLTGAHGRIIVHTADRSFREKFNDDDEHWCTDEEMCPDDMEFRISVYEMAQLTHDNMRCQCI